MPSYTITRGFCRTTLTTLNSISYPNSSVPRYKRYVTRTDTVRRVKPKDLFANSTSFGFEVTETFENECSWYNPDDRRTYIYPVADFITGGSYVEYPNYQVEFGGKLRAKIKKVNVNLAQNLGEYRQTSSMFASLARDLHRTFRSLRSGRALKDFVRILSRPRDKTELAIANRWLQYQYGLRPLVGDIYASLELLHKKVKEGHFVYVQASSSGSGSKVEKFSNKEFFRNYTWTYRAKARCRYKISDPSLKSLAETGISNPLLLAWELIPYSFVIDWMFNVGEFLSSLDALNGTSNLIWTYGALHTSQCNYGYKNGKSQVLFRNSFRSGILTNLSLPRLTYKPSTSLTAVLNGLALLTQIRKR